MDSEVSKTFQEIRAKRDLMDNQSDLQEAKTQRQLRTEKDLTVQPKTQKKGQLMLFKKKMKML